MNDEPIVSIQSDDDLVEKKGPNPGDELFERDLPVFIGWNLETVVGKGKAVMGEDGRVHMDISFATHETEAVLEFFSQIDPMALSFGGYNRLDRQKPEIALKVTREDHDKFAMKKENDK